MAGSARAVLLVLGLLVAGCARETSSQPRWTEREAASITTVRSLPVRVLYCRGLGEPDGETFARFDCVAGTRAPWETYDTISVSYVLRPLAEYEGPRSPHRMTTVRFIGGPGIP